MEPETGQWWLYCEAIKAECEGDKGHAEALWVKYREAEKKFRAQLDAMLKMFASQG